MSEVPFKFPWNGTSFDAKRQRDFTADNKATGKRQGTRPPRLHLLLHPPYNVQFLG
jgi:hypothetical protein